MAIVVDAIYEERYWYPEDGGQVWLAGYQLVEPESGRYLARDAAELAARYEKATGHAPQIYVCAAANGAEEVTGERNA